MQSPHAINDFPHSPPSQSNRRIELENEYIQAAAASHFQLPKQQPPSQHNHTPQLCLQEQAIFEENQLPSNKRHRPGVATNFLYKLTELAAYTSAVASEAYQTLTGVVGPDGLPIVPSPQIPPQILPQIPQQRQVTNNHHHFNNRYSMAFDGYGDDIMQIKAEEEDFDMIEEEITETVETDLKKNVVDWSNMNAYEEPPPPYDSSWSMPSPSAQSGRFGPGTPTVRFAEPETIQQHPNQEQEQFTTRPKPTEPMNIIQPEGHSISAPTTPTGANNSRGSRRQIRVRRGRPLRRKTSWANLPIPAISNFKSEEGGNGEDYFQKFNGKLADMIAEGTAALTSTVDVTEVEMMLAEEREREEKIMKDLGRQSAASRRHRRMASSSSSEYDYFGSMSESNSYSGEYNFEHNSGSDSPTGYSTPGGYSSTPNGAYSMTPTRYGSPGGYGATFFGGSTLGNAFTTLTSMTGSTLGGAFGSTIGGGFNSNSGLGLYGTTTSNSTFGIPSSSNYGIGMYGSNSTTSTTISPPPPPTTTSSPSSSTENTSPFNLRRYY
ncbi:hypothetical protein G9A89_020016 [Geosiphon pyriformis]|nr:hypothetical protein G9A89_020016 [Geosiphon pyriformis]